MIDVKENVVDRLVAVYLHKQNVYEKKLPVGEAYKYFEKLIYNNIVFCEVNGKLVGYVEFWILDYEQLGRVICREPFAAYLEDISNGNVCYVSDVWIDEEYRNTEIYKLLKNKLRLKNFDKKFYVGDRLKNGKRSIHIQKIREADNE